MFKTQLSFRTTAIIVGIFDLIAIGAYFIGRHNVPEVLSGSVAVTLGAIFLIVINLGVFFLHYHHNEDEWKRPIKG